MTFLEILISEGIYCRNNRCIVGLHVNTTEDNGRGNSVANALYGVTLGIVCTVIWRGSITHLQKTVFINGFIHRYQTFVINQSIRSLEFKSNMLLIRTA